MPIDNEALEKSLVLDKDRLMEISDGDMMFLVDLLGDYMGNLAALEEQLKAYSSARNIEELRKSAHTIAGSSLNVGANRLACFARQVEDALKHGEVDDALQMIAGVTRLLNETRDAIAVYSTMSFH